MDDWGACDFAHCDIEIKEEPLDDPPDDVQEADNSEAALCFESVDVASRENVDYDAYPQGCPSLEDNLADPLYDDSLVKSVLSNQDIAAHKPDHHLSKDPFYHPFQVKIEPVSYETPSEFSNYVSENVNGSTLRTEAHNEQFESVLKIKEEKSNPDFEQASETCTPLNGLEPSNAWQVTAISSVAPIPPRDESWQQNSLEVKETVISNELQNSWLLLNAPGSTEKITGDLGTQDSLLDQKHNEALFLIYAHNKRCSNPTHQTGPIITNTSLQTVNRKKSLHVPITPFAENSSLRKAFGSYTQSKPMKHKSDILLLNKPKKSIESIPSSTCQQKIVEKLTPAPSTLNHKSRKQVLTPRVEISTNSTKVPKEKIKRQRETVPTKSYTNTSRRVLSKVVNTNSPESDLSKMITSRELLALQSWNWCKPKSCNLDSSDCSEGLEGRLKSDIVKQELNKELDEQVEDMCLADRLKSDKHTFSGPTEPMDTSREQVKSENFAETNNLGIPSVVGTPRKPRKQSLQTTRVQCDFSNVGSDSMVKSEQTVASVNMFIPEDTLYISCIECRRMFLHDHYYKAHLKPFPNRYRSCQVCHEPCRNICKLQAHYVFHATDEGKSYCQLNKSDFHSKPLLLQYVQLFNGNPNGYFTCNCGKTYQWHYSFYKHIKQKFESCKQKNMFDSLIRAQKRKKYLEDRASKAKMALEISLPKCSTCNLEFYNRYDYLEHIRFAHLVIYNCDFCAYEVGNDKLAMYNHIQKHLIELEQHLPENNQSSETVP